MTLMGKMKIIPLNRMALTAGSFSTPAACVQFSIATGSEAVQVSQKGYSSSQMGIKK